MGNRSCYLGWFCNVYVVVLCLMPQILLSSYLGWGNFWVPPPSPHHLWSWTEEWALYSSFWHLEAPTPAWWAFLWCWIDIYSHWSQNRHRDAALIPVCWHLCIGKDPKSPQHTQSWIWLWPMYAVSFSLVGQHLRFLLMNPWVPFVCDVILWIWLVNVRSWLIRTPR